MSGWRAGRRKTSSPSAPRTRATSPPKDSEGVYVGLDDLMRLEFKARGYTFLPHQPVHSILTGRHGSRIRGRGFDFEEIRAYQQGDDVRSIDWRVTARIGKPHVRVFTEERDHPVLLVVDQRLSMFYGTRVRMKSVVAAESAALAAWRVVDQGDRVGALIFDDAEVTEIKPRRGRNNVIRVLESVVEKNQALRASSKVASDPGMLNRALEMALRTVTHDHLLCVISDFDGADSHTRELLLRVARHNDVLGVLVHDPSAFRLPRSGRFVLSDGELQIEVDLAGRKVHRNVSDFSAGRIRRLLEWQKDAGIPMMPIDTVGGVAEQVRTLLGAARESRRR